MSLGGVRERKEPSPGPRNPVDEVSQAVTLLGRGIEETSCSGRECQKNHICWRWVAWKRSGRTPCRLVVDHRRCHTRRNQAKCGHAVLGTGPSWQHKLPEHVQLHCGRRVHRQPRRGWRASSPRLREDYQRVGPRSGGCRGQHCKGLQPEEEEAPSSTSTRPWPIPCRNAGGRTPLA